MMIRSRPLLLLPLFILLSCGEQEKADSEESKKAKSSFSHPAHVGEQADKGAAHKGAPLAIEKGKIYRKNGRKYLWGGKDSSTHFDITNCSLKDSNFHFGLGREKFEALVGPEYLPMEKADSLYADGTDFLATRINGEARAYPLDLLKRHEVVNDRIGGAFVFAAYCHLADLAAVYPRVIQGDTLTFALSGYTYYEEDEWEGRDAFVLWDRQTESLWWPIHEKAVSGKKKGTPLKVYDESKWDQLTWKKVKEKYPKAKVLKKGQKYREDRRAVR
jgi:hypothetical protein